MGSGFLLLKKRALPNAENETEDQPPSKKQKESSSNYEDEDEDRLLSLPLKMSGLNSDNLSIFMNTVEGEVVISPQPNSLEERVLENHVIVHNIFNHSRARDLKQFRLVNKLWDELAVSSLIRKKSLKLTIRKVHRKKYDVLPSQISGIHTHFSDSKRRFPFACLDLEIEAWDWVADSNDHPDNINFDFNHLTRFFRVYGPNFTELFLTDLLGEEDYDIDPDPQPPEKLKDLLLKYFPHVEDLSVDFAFTTPPSLEASLNLDQEDGQEDDESGTEGENDSFSVELDSDEFDDVDDGVSQSSGIDADDEDDGNSVYEDPIRLLDEKKEEDKLEDDEGSIYFDAKEDNNLKEGDEVLDDAESVVSEQEEADDDDDELQFEPLPAGEVVILQDYIFFDDPWPEEHVKLFHEPVTLPFLKKMWMSYVRFPAVYEDIINSSPNLQCSNYQSNFLEAIEKAGRIDLIKEYSDCLHDGGYWLLRLANLGPKLDNLQVPARFYSPSIEIYVACRKILISSKESLKSLSCFPYKLFSTSENETKISALVNLKKLIVWIHEKGQDQPPIFPEDMDVAKMFPSLDIIELNLKSCVEESIRNYFPKDEFDQNKCLVQPMASVKQLTLNVSLNKRNVATVDTFGMLALGKKFPNIKRLKVGNGNGTFKSGNCDWILPWEGLMYIVLCGFCYEGGFWKCAESLASFFSKISDLQHLRKMMIVFDSGKNFDWKLPQGFLRIKNPILAHISWLKLSRALDSLVFAYDMDQANAEDVKVLFEPLVPFVTFEHEPLTSRF